MRTLRAAVATLLTAALPTRCFACGDPLRKAQRLGACARCWAALRPLRGPLCRCCAWPLAPAAELGGAAGGRCAPCTAGRPILDAAIALVAYDGAARRFLLRGKLGRRREVLGALGAQLAERVVLENLAGEGAIVVPIPSHPFARLRRGFDPAEEVARSIAARTGLVLRPILRRNWKYGRSLKRLGATARRRVAREAFRIRNRSGVDGASVLLVDDVLTTGATLSACASALRDAGADSVRAAVWARTAGPSRALLVAPPTRRTV